jgi:hypothetical protein
VLGAVVVALVPDPIEALVRIHSVEREDDVVAPAVPLVPVAPDVAPPRSRHPVTVIVRLLLELGVVWLVALCEVVGLVLCDDVDPACAPSVAAQPSAIANVAPVHTRFIVVPP